VTWLNERLATFPYVRAEPIQWRSADGACISGLLYRPLNYQEGRACPLIVQVHGGPAWLWSDRFMATWHDWAQPLALRGYAVLCPNPRGSIGRGAAFTDAEVNDIGGKELADVLSGVDAVIAMGVADPDRLGIGGWSHGGYLAAWTITQTDRFRGAVMGAGVSNMLSDQGENDIPRFNDDYFDQTIYDNHAPYWERSPIAHVAKVRTPTLILHGEKDDRVTQPQGQEMYRALKRMGVETEFVTYPREPHSIGERAHQIDLLERVLSWFDRYVKRE
jgi:dipeptidyl aminopeptidase/acylaminoacyl peptidase